MRPALIERLPSRLLLSRTLYVAPTGNDDSPKPTDIHEPFLTIGRAAAVARPGDTVVVRGGTYRETVAPDHSGKPGAPITFEPYRHEVVTIDGADPVTGWTADGDDAYSAPYTGPAGVPGGQFLAGGVALPAAQWPAATAGWATAAAGTADGTIVDPALSAGWVGATVHYLGGYGWGWQTATVTTSAAGRLTFGPGSVDPALAMTPGGRYFLTDAAAGQIAVAPGESAYAAGRLTVATADGSPPTDVEAAARSDAFDLTGRSYVHVAGFRLLAATIVTGPTSHDDVIDAVRVRYPSSAAAVTGSVYSAGVYDTGVQLYGYRNAIENSEVADSAGDGIALLGHDDRATGDLVHGCDTAGSYAAGIVVEGYGHRVLHDTVYDTGSSAVVGRRGTDGTFHDNRIAYDDLYDYGRLTHDLGGVYVNFADATGTSIDHNWVHDAAAEPTVVEPGDLDTVGAAGVYLDAGASHARVAYNAVWDTTFHGLLLNEAYADFSVDGRVVTATGTSLDNLVSHNTVVPDGPGGGSGDSLLVSADDTAGTRLVDNLLATPALAAAPGQDVRAASTAAALPAARESGPVAARLMPRRRGVGAYPVGAAVWTAGAKISAVFPPAD